MKRTKTPGMFRARVALALAFASSAASIAAPAPRRTHRFRITDNLILLPVVVDGHAGSGVLDTGTSGIAIDRAFAHASGVPEGTRLGKADVSGIRPITLWRTDLRELRMPDRELEREPAIILDMGAYARSSGSPVDVVLGLPFFRHRLVSIDYPNRVLTIASGLAERLRCAARITFRLVDGTPVVEASGSFAGGRTRQRLRLMVDLGTRHQAMLLGASFLATPAGDSLRRNAARTRVASGAGGAVFGWSAIAGSLTLGARSYGNVPFAASSQLSSSKHPPYDGTLGVPFWNSGTIGFDYDRRLLCLPDGRGVRHPP